MSAVGQLVFDEYGKPIIILKDQDQQKRLTGIDALKVRGGAVTMGPRCFAIIDLLREMMAFFILTKANSCIGMVKFYRATWVLGFQSQRDVKFGEITADGRTLGQDDSQGNPPAPDNNAKSYAINKF